MYCRELNKEPFKCNLLHATSEHNPLLRGMPGAKSSRCDLKSLWIAGAEPNLVACEGRSSILADNAINLALEKRTAIRSLTLHHRRQEKR